MVQDQVVYEFIKAVWPLVFFGALATAIYGIVITIREAD